MLVEDEAITLLGFIDYAADLGLTPELGVVAEQIKKQLGMAGQRQTVGSGTEPGLNAEDSGLDTGLGAL